jgi:hypothetical protein
MGQWKLIEWFESGRIELYNLRDDIGEQNDLAKADPDKAEQLLTALRQWRKEVDAPIPSTPNPKYQP